MGDQTIVIPDPGTTTVTVDTPSNPVVTQPVTPNGMVVVQASGLLGPPPGSTNPFLSLTDVPSSYIGFESYTVKVKADGTGLEFVNVAGGGGGGGGGTWGSITGTLSAQTDLATALSGKATSAQGAKADSALQAADISSFAIAWTQVTGKPAFAAVATTGAYGDLSGLPTLGTAAAQPTGAFAAASHTHAAGDIVSGTLADARVAASNVTQHQAALSISWSQVGSRPTTLAGYGIADALLSATAASTYATITNLALKAPLASPALTGTPTAPTASPSTNSTQIATTAYTDAAVAAASGGGIADAPNNANAYIRKALGWVILTQDLVPDGSTNKAYTAAEKTKLGGIATGATANSPDATLLARANHTGSQASSTISDFNTAVDARIALGGGGGGGTTIVVGTTAPSFPSVNDLWVDTN